MPQFTNHQPGFLSNLTLSIFWPKGNAYSAVQSAPLCHSWLVRVFIAHHIIIQLILVSFHSLLELRIANVEVGAGVLQGSVPTDSVKSQWNLILVIEVASGDYGDQWASILAKAIALSSDSDSSGLANDCSGSENASEHSSLAGTTGKKVVPALKAGDKQDKDLVVTLMPPMESDDSSTPMGSLGSINGDCRCGRFWNQFSTLFKRSFVCIMRDTVSKQALLSRSFS